MATTKNETSKVLEPPKNEDTSLSDCLLLLSVSVDNIIEDYPSSTTSNVCSFIIPFSIKSEYNLEGVTFSYSGGDTYVQKAVYSEDRKSLYSVFSSPVVNSDSSVTVTLIFTDNSQITSTNITLLCKSFSSQFKSTVLSSGLYYNTLALLLYYESLDIDKSVQLNIVSPSIQYSQSYLGNKTFFISFLNNDQSFFQGATIPLNLKINSNIYEINVQSPFIASRSENKFNYQLYPNSITSLHSSAILELNTTSSSLVNNQFSVLDSFGSVIDEPYFIGSTKNNQYRYLSPLSSSIKGQDTVFTILHNIKSGSNKTIYQNQNALNFNNLENTITIDSNKKITLEEYYFYYQFQFSGSNLPISVQFGSPLKKFGFPFGYSSVTQDGTIKYSFTSSETSSNLKYKTITLDYIIDKQSSSVDIPPREMGPPNEEIQIVKFNSKLIARGRLLLEISLKYQLYKVRSLTIYKSASSIYDVFPIDSILVGKENSDNKVIDIEINIPRVDIYKIGLANTYSQITEYYLGSNNYYNLNGQFQYLKNLTNLDQLPQEFEYSKSLKSVSFLYNDLKVTNIRVSNKMFVKFDNYPVDREIKVTFIYSDSRARERSDIFYSNYNQQTSTYEIEFNIPKNIKTGTISYVITLDSLDKLNYYSFALPSEYQLRIIESKNIDLMGPIVTALSTFEASGNLGWRFTIESTNGFKKGYATVRGSKDFTERNITIIKSSSGADDINYEAMFGGYCRAQEFEITYAYFEDTEGQFTEYNLFGDNKFNPFYKINGSHDSFRSALKLSSQFGCSITASPDIPELKELSFPEKVYFSSSSSRIVKFKYSIYHQDGIFNQLLPTVYISSYDFKFASSSNTQVLTTNSTYTTFETELEVPYLFGINSNVSVSVYGFTSISGMVSGFDSDAIRSLGLPYSFLTTKGTQSIIITGSSTLSSTGLGGVWIYGKGFDLVSEFQIQYIEQADSLAFNSIESTSKSSTAVYLPTIKATSYQIKIRATDSNGQFTDPFTINPIIYNFIDQGTPSNNSSLCQGSPLCGGSSHGLCYSTGCKCISPWIGLDCMSQVIKVPPPKIDETNPSTNITLGEDISITSILSIVGIKELSINGNEVNKYLFDQWEYKLISNDSISTKYSYSSIIKKDNKEVSNITATLDWYKEESVIYFANSELKLNPSTIKYTIKITSYPFTSQLNTLQLIMKASIQSTNSDSCTDKQFGELSQDDSDYIKLQVDNYSFYGRFIKRCIIDNDQIITLTNTLLDSTMNDNLTNNHQTSQSYIGINIGQFQDNVVIDPDFSVILDSSFTKGNCKSSGLTTSQLVGIIVGSVCFFLVLLIIISFIIYKSHGCIPVKIFFYKLFKKSKV